MISRSHLCLTIASRPSRPPTSRSPQFTGKGAEPQGRTGTAGKRLPARGGAAGPGAGHGPLSLSAGGAGRRATRASLSMWGGCVVLGHTRLSLCSWGGGTGSCWPPFLCRGGSTGGAGPSAPGHAHLSFSVVGGVLGHAHPSLSVGVGAPGRLPGHGCLCKGQEWTQSHGPSFAVPLFLAPSEVPKKPLKTISPGICLCRVYGHPLCTAK